MNITFRIGAIVFLVATTGLANKSVEDERVLAKQLGDKYVSSHRYEYGCESDVAKSMIVLRSAGLASKGIPAFEKPEFARSHFCYLGGNYVIDQQGVVYGCRSEVINGIPSRPNTNHNTAVIGVTLLGDFHDNEYHKVTEQALDSLHSLLATLSVRRNIPLDAEHVHPFLSALHLIE